VVVGALRPRIVLPQETATSSDIKAVRAALAHEWAHICHGDLWLLALERFLMPLLALHPLFWWFRRSTRLDQELLADAVAAGDKPVEYAEALVAWTKAAPPATVGLAALAMWERPSNLSRRVHMILDHKRRMSSRLGRLCGFLAAALLLALAVGLSVITLHPVAASQETDEPPLAPPVVDAPTEIPREVSLAPVVVDAPPAAPHQATSSPEPTPANSQGGQRQGTGGQPQGNGSQPQGQRRQPQGEGGQQQGGAALPGFSAPRLST